MGNFEKAITQFDILFFGLMHIIGMTVGIVLIIFGSAIAKLQDIYTERFKLMALWFTFALLLILITISWPFHHLLNDHILDLFNYD